MYNVYLAGPITGCSFGECTDWREAFSDAIRPFGIQGLSPMRGKDYLQSERVIVHDYPQHLLSSQRGIMTRDFFDCMRADIVVVNLLGSKIVSIGTVMEIAWAYANKTPVVCIMESESNIHDHPMIREAIGFRVETVEQAIETVKIVLFPTEVAALIGA